MKQGAPTFYEQVDAAVESGDRRQLGALYRRSTSLYGTNYHGQEISANMLAATTNAAKLDPAKLQHDLVLEVLCMQGTLLHRVDEAIRVAIARHDKEDNGLHPWGCLPEKVSDELLPRYAKIAAEVFSTIKLLRKMGSPSAPAGATAPGVAPANDQGDSGDEDVQADGTDADA